jgi:uncharacterized radical SAM superfamily Fe-S cluster-containing enzyme
VCLKQVQARLVRDGGEVYMEKNCPTHGDFTVIVWRDKVSMECWRGNLPELSDDENTRCPHGCAGCWEHLQGSCCVLLEVTGKCDLRCKYCFADNIEHEPSLDELKRSIDDVMGSGDNPLLQFSGGEPTMRDDLPELVAYAHEKGCPYTQLNSNGLRLCEDEKYVAALARAGLSFVFMQFDGVRDSVYEALRGAPLLEQKLRTIEMCDKYNIGVTLVPTIVRGINDDQIGGMIRLASSLSPAVRGIHFQPVSYFGRYPDPSIPLNEDRFTLDELLSCIGEQTDIDISALRPSRCDHPLCGFHGSFIASGESLQPLSLATASDCCGTTTARRNREYVGGRWKREAKTETCCCRPSALTKSLDDFLISVKTHGFTISAMAFQDAMNLDIERIRRCSLHVYDKGVLRPFCAKYLTPVNSAK